MKKEFWLDVFIFLQCLSIVIKGIIIHDESMTIGWSACFLMSIRMLLNHIK